LAPSFVSPTIASAAMVGCKPRVSAERLTRSAWRSRSGVTPSNARAPSNTVEPSQEAWERGPMIGGLPSCHSPSIQVQVSEYQGTLKLPSARKGRRRCRTRRARRAGVNAAHEDLSWKAGRTLIGRADGLVRAKPKLPLKRGLFPC
jgi:hypothetical protein